MPYWVSGLTGVSWLGVAALAGCGDVRSLAGSADTGTAHVHRAGPDATADFDAGVAPGVDASSGVDGAVDALVIVTPETFEAGVCPAPMPPTSVCGAALCGNGHVDTCSQSFGCGGGGGGGGGPPGGGGGGPNEGDGGCTSTASENCDGTDLGGASCASLGFSGGTLRCNAGCGYDVSGCDHCGTDSHIASCGNVSVDAAGVSAMAIAAGANGVGLAWSTGSAGAAGLHVAILGADLHVVSEVGCIASGTVGAVAIAATPSGWMVAAEIEGGVGVYPLGSTGAPVGHGHLLAGASAPILASNPDGGPLLVWVSTTGYGGYVSPLALDGTVTSSTVAFEQVVEPQYGSAVYVGDGFLVALRASDGATVIHVSKDGSLGVPHSMGSETEYPKVAWTGTEGRVVYGDFSGEAKLELQRVDGTGTPLGGPIEVGSTPAYYDPAPNATAGSDSVVILPGYTGDTGIASHLDVTRVTMAGTSVYAPYVVAKAGSVDDLSGYALVPSGDGLVLAWLTASAPGANASGVFPGSIGLARITP